MGTQRERDRERERERVRRERETELYTSFTYFHKNMYSATDCVFVRIAFIFHWFVFITFPVTAYFSPEKNLSLSLQIF